MNIIEDIKAIYRNDPAARNIEFLLYPCFHVMLVHRFLNHPLSRLGVPFIPRLLSQVMRFLTGIELHPGARIGAGFFIDHGMGVVIGETTVIGKNCVLFHNCTLGGTGHVADTRRHPRLGDHVLMGTGATLLGPITVGDGAKIGAETVVINRDVPSNCSVVGAPGKIVRENGVLVDKELPVATYWKKHHGSEDLIVGQQNVSG
ncbi:MAG: serine O-acetyltransferase [Nanoarchaeota archaeon]|nr:serine O-acetyltransferase [Nanoarchaeota archaeon]